MSCNISRRTCVCIAVIAVFILAVTAALLGIMLSFDSLIEAKLAKSISVLPSSAVYSNWVSPDTPVLFSIYLFNITNKEDILAGKKPHVHEIGPYVYREKREKTNITWPADGSQSTVTFYQRVTYFLDRELSVGNPDKDIVVGLNVPFVAIASGMSAGMGPSESELFALTLFATPQLFVELPVTKYLWGYKDDIVEACHISTPEKCKTDKVGLMLGKNGTDDGPFTIDTGFDGVSTLGNILAYKGKDTVDVWSTKDAGKIFGTDGSHMAPNLSLNSSRYIFSSDLCRSFLLDVKGKAKLTNSDKLAVFSVGGAAVPYNRGFCPIKTPGPECPPPGLFDLSSCKAQGDMLPPIYSSQPRFYGADPSLAAAVDGMVTPTDDNSNTMVYVEPTTGLVLEAYKRLQITVFINQTTALSVYFKKFKEPIFFPVVWFEEKAVADAKSLEMLYDNLHVLPKTVYKILLACFTSFLVIFFLLCLLLVLRACYCGTSGAAGKSVGGERPWNVPDAAYHSVNLNEHESTNA